MKVLFVLPSFHTNLHVGLRGLLNHGIDAVLLLEKPGRGHLPGLRVEVLGQAGMSFSEARGWLRRESPDLVVIHKTRTLSRPFYMAALAGRWPVLGYDYRPQSRPVPSWLLPVRAWLGRPPHRMTPVLGLPRTRARIDRRATYVPFPVDSAAPDAGRAYAPDGRVRLLCVAKLAEARKNQRLLIKALETLAPRFDFSLTLVGASSLSIRHPDPEQLEWLHRYVESGPLAGRVAIRADVPFAQMASIYAAHDVCILPARKEPLGMAPLEAMGWGCVPVVSDQCGSAGTIVAGEAAGLPCGAVVETDDHASLERTLGKILASPDLLRTLGRNATIWANGELSGDRFVERFLALAARRGARTPTARQLLDRESVA